MSKIMGLDNELQKLGVLAPLGFALGLHVRFVTPLISLHTWPQSWQDHYTENVYGLRDPMVAWAFTKTGYCRWDDCPFPDPFSIIKQARKHGLNFGATISCGPLSSRTIVGVARADRDFRDLELEEIEKLVVSMHAATEPPKSLTTAQKEALVLVGEGCRHAEAAHRLGISESALKLRLSGARNRLLARTTAEAVQRAKDYKLI
jgi:LuxR family transcriptional regulator